MDGLFEPRGCLPVGAQGDERWRHTRGFGLIIEERHDAGDRGRLARAGPAAHDGEPTQHDVAAARHWRSGAAVESLFSPSASPGTSTSLQVRCGEQVSSDELVTPIAIEVDRRADEAERPALVAVLSDSH